MEVKDSKTNVAHFRKRGKSLTDYVVKFGSCALQVVKVYIEASYLINLLPLMRLLKFCRIYLTYQSITLCLSLLNKLERIEIPGTFMLGLQLSQKQKTNYSISQYKIGSLNYHQLCRTGVC